jgi:RNA polymerase sigma-70 factor (ECF subfamily)
MFEYKLSMKNLERRKTESELVERIRDDDATAFERLFFAYCQRLIDFTRRFVGDTAIAENIVQDVFLKIWTTRKQLNPSSNIKSYLYTIAKNEALKQLRHEDVRQQSAERLRSSAPHVQTPEEKLSELEIGASVRQAIAELPEQCQIIFSMNRFDLLTYAEIAEVMNLSIKTVETHMERALEALRKRLRHLL